MTPYLKGLKLWPYISGNMPKPTATEVDTQALSMILMNITLKVQAVLDSSSAKAAWDGLLSINVHTDPITQNLTQTMIVQKGFVEGISETLPAHIAALQILREACRGLGVDITDALFSGIITLFMLTPS